MILKIEIGADSDACMTGEGLSKGVEEFNIELWADRVRIEFDFKHTEKENVSTEICPESLIAACRQILLYYDQKPT